MAIRVEVSDETRKTFRQIIKRTPDVASGTPWMAQLLKRLAEQMHNESEFRFERLYLLNPAEKCIIDQIRESGPDRRIAPQEF